jgi:alanine racemase
MSRQEMTGQRPTWAEIDLDGLAHNLGVIRRQVGPETKIMAAVKANAYGHGAVECARRLEAEGVDWFGVALPEEGIELRESGISRPILCLGGFWQGQESACLQYRLTPVVDRLDETEAFNSVARDAGIKANVHLKIDTGMGRLGVRSEKVSQFCEGLQRLSNIRVDGLMTHLAAADDDALEAFTTTQLKRFESSVLVCREHGIDPVYFHVANSAATFAFSQGVGNMVRPGGSLYGFVRDVFPANMVRPVLKPVMSVHSRIALLKSVSPGEKLGYGCTFETKRESLIGTIPIGYDDGYRRALSNRGQMIVRGHLAPVVGRISMDMTLIDVTDVPNVAIDDYVTLLGSEGEVTITAEDLGELAGTISYEITCGISNRVPRIYLEDEPRD